MECLSADTFRNRGWWGGGGGASSHESLLRKMRPLSSWIYEVFAPVCGSSRSNVAIPIQQVAQELLRSRTGNQTRPKDVGYASLTALIGLNSASFRGLKGWDVHVLDKADKKADVIATRWDAHEGLGFWARQTKNHVVGDRAVKQSGVKGW